MAISERLNGVTKVNCFVTKCPPIANDQLLHAQVHQAMRDGGQCMFNQGPRFGHAQLRLHLLDGLGLGGGVHEQRSVFQQRRSPGQYLLNYRIGLPVHQAGRGYGHRRSAGGFEVRYLRIGSHRATA